MRRFLGKARHDRAIKRLIDEIYSAPAGAVQNALVALLAAEENLAATLAAKTRVLEARTSDRPS